MSIDKKYSSSILITIIGLLIIKYELRFDGEFGFIGPILSILGWTTILIIIVIELNKLRYDKKQIKYNSLPIWTTLIVVILTIAANRITYFKLNSENKLIAISNKPRAGHPDKLQLKTNRDYYAQMDEIEWAYRQSGEYSIEKDTLHLDKILISDRGEIVFRNLYIFSSDKKYLIPVLDGTASIDSSEWLTIVKNTSR